MRIISIHATPRGGRQRCYCAGEKQQHFNPRPREGGDLDGQAVGDRVVVFQSTPPARGATQLVQRIARLLNISIHAPREGGDGAGRQRPEISLRISIHAPREGGDSGRHSWPP